MCQQKDAKYIQFSFTAEILLISITFLKYTRQSYKIVKKHSEAQKAYVGRVLGISSGLVNLICIRFLGFLDAIFLEARLHLGGSAYENDRSYFIFADNLVSGFISANFLRLLSTIYR